jgi:hypothetical protein
MARQQATPKTSARAVKAMQTVTEPHPDEGDQATPTPAAPFDREQAIREAAYACYEARGGEPGYELDDWLTAEAQVQQANGGGGTDSGIEQIKH